MTSQKHNRYLYRAYGINIASEIECPELLEGGDPVDVQISIGEVPETLEGDYVSGRKFYAKPDQLLIHTNTIAKILVSEGKRIVVEPRPGAEDYEVRLLLLGWGLGGLLQQRELLPLHAAAVKIGQESLLFCADPQVGKSTLTAAFVQKGYKFLDDNIVALQNIDSFPQVIPGYPNIKLWGDAMVRLDLKHAILQPVRPNITKYALDFRDMFHDAPIPIGGIYILTRTSDTVIGLNSLSGSEKFTALLEQIFCRRFMGGLGKEESLFKSLVNLVKKIEVKQVHLPENRPSARKLAKILLDDYHSRPAKI